MPTFTSETKIFFIVIGIIVFVAFLRLVYTHQRHENRPSSHISVTSGRRQHGEEDVESLNWPESRVRERNMRGMVVERPPPALLRRDSSVSMLPEYEERGKGEDEVLTQSVELERRGKYVYVVPQRADRF